MRNQAIAALFLTCGIMAVVKAQPGNISAFAGGPVALLATNKTVQKDLEMTDDQIAKVKEWSTDMRSKAADIRKEKGVDFLGKGAKGLNPTIPEFREKIAAANAEIKKVSYRELGEILKTKQIDRLKQIDRQNMGIGAFIDDEVTAALKLTDTQKTSIQELGANQLKAITDIMKAALADGPDIEKLQNAQKEVQKIEKELMNKAVLLLTDDQKKKWKALTGEPFDLEKLHIQVPKKKD
jgi:hypothetical protein